MAEKTEWEVVDAAPQETRQSTPDMMQTLLGPWWRWKIAGAIAIAGGFLVLFATLAGLIVLAMSAGALVLIGIGKLRQWLRRADLP